MLQMPIAILYGLAVFVFGMLSMMELWKSRQSIWVKVLGTAFLSGLELIVLYIAAWLTGMV